MIVAMRCCAAVAKRSRTRGRSIGRKTPPRSGRPSAATLRITAGSPYSPGGGHPWRPAAEPDGPGQSLRSVNVATVRSGLEHDWPDGREAEPSGRPGYRGAAAVPKRGLAAFARDQPEIPARLERRVRVDAAERLFADLRAELAPLAHRHLELAERALELVAVERRDLLLEPVDVAVEPALHLVADLALRLMDAREQRVELLDRRQSERRARRFLRGRRGGADGPRFVARARCVEVRIEPDDRLDALRSFG